MSDYAELVKRLDGMAVSASKASTMLAAAKTQRNQAAGDAHALYHGIEPHETTEYEAARAIEALSAELERVRNKALEEAARCAEQEEETYNEGMSAIDVRLSFTRGPRWRDGRAIAATIRALMSKEQADV